MDMSNDELRQLIERIQQGQQLGGTNDQLTQVQAGGNMPQLQTNLPDNPQVQHELEHGLLGSVDTPQQQTQLQTPPQAPVQQAPVQVEQTNTSNMDQARQHLANNSSQLANNMLQQAQAQTQEAEQASQQLSAQRDAQMQQTAQQSQQEYQKQEQEKKQRQAQFLKLAMMIGTGMSGGGAGGAELPTDAGVYSGGWLV